MKELSKKQANELAALGQLDQRRSRQVLPPHQTPRHCPHRRQHPRLAQTLRPPATKPASTPAKVRGRYMWRNAPFRLATLVEVI